MLKKKNLRWIKFMLAAISFALLSIVVLTIFEYTAVADVREYFSDVDKQEALEYGKVLFDTRGCAACHAIEPNIKSLGPNLFELPRKFTEEYIRQSIITPGAVIVSGYEDVVMPNFGQILDEDQINALVEYVASIRG